NTAAVRAPTPAPTSGKAHDEAATAPSGNGRRCSGKLTGMRVSTAVANEKSANSPRLASMPATIIGFAVKGRAFPAVGPLGQSEKSMAGADREPRRDQGFVAASAGARSRSGYRRRAARASIDQAGRSLGAVGGAGRLARDLAGASPAGSRAPAHGR